MEMSEYCLNIDASEEQKTSSVFNSLKSDGFSAGNQNKSSGIFTSQPGSANTGSSYSSFNTEYLEISTAEKHPKHSSLGDRKQLESGHVLHAGFESFGLFSRRHFRKERG